MNSRQDAGDEGRTDYDRLAGEKYCLERVIEILAETAALSARDDDTGVFNELVSRAIELLGAGSGSLMLRQEGSDHLTIASAVGVSNEVKWTTFVKIGEGIAGSVARSKEPVLLTEGSPAAGDFHLKQTDKIKDSLSAPIVWREEVLGVLNVNNKQNGTFSEADVGTMLIIANQAAVVLHERQNRGAVDRSYLSMVTTLAETLDARDTYTFGHSKAVRDYSVGIGRKLGLGAAGLHTIELTALLHDLGKLSIPDAVLLKKGRLDPDEYALIKTHPQVGARILEPVAYFSDIIPGILHHHEKYDGSGYPDGLRAEAIPLEARILAIADAFDSMSSKRVYRRLLSTEQILSELKQGRGRQFDPGILDVFLEEFQIDRGIYRAGESRLGDDIHHAFNYYTLAVKDRPEEVELLAERMSEIISAFMGEIDRYGGPLVKERVIKKLNVFSIEHRLDFIIADGQPNMDKLLPVTLVEATKRFQAYVDRLITITAGTLSSRAGNMILREVSKKFDGPTKRLFDLARGVRHLSRQAA